MAPYKFYLLTYLQQVGEKVVRLKVCRNQKCPEKRFTYFGIDGFRQLKPASGATSQQRPDLVVPAAEDGALERGRADGDVSPSLTASSAAVSAAGTHLRQNLRLRLLCLLVLVILLNHSLSNSDVTIRCNNLINYLSNC